MHITIFRFKYSLYLAPIDKQGLCIDQWLGKF